MVGTVLLISPVHTWAAYLPTENIARRRPRLARLIVRYVLSVFPSRFPSLLPTFEGKVPTTRIGLASDSMLRIDRLASWLFFVSSVCVARV